MEIKVGFKLFLEILLAAFLSAIFCTNAYTASSFPNSQLTRVTDNPQGETNNGISPNDWSLHAEPEIVLIHGEIIIPIVIGYKYTAISDTWGKFVYNNNELQSLTKTPVLVTKHKKEAIFDRRPTLFVSIPGAFSNNQAPWQSTLQENIFKTIGKTSQYRHYIVDWGDKYPMSRQIDDLSEVISRFLSNRTVKWDVVLVGHSRGGVFTHAVSQKIYGNSNIENLFTVLLDPTASRFSNDKYPSKNTGGDKVLGYNYYDGESFIDNAGALQPSLGTVGDMPISGYHNQLVDNISHSEFGNAWANDTGSNGMRFNHTLSQLNDRKSISPNSYAADGDSGVEVIKIRNKKVDLRGDIDLNDGRITANLNIDIGPASAGFDGYIGNGGAEVTTNLIINYSHISIQSDRIEVSKSNLAGDFSASFSEHGVKANVDVVGVLGTEIEADLTKFSVNIKLFNADVEINSIETGSFLVFIDKDTDDILSDIHKKISGKTIVGSAGNAVKKIFGF